MRLEGFLSRSGESHPLGKLTFELPKTKVAEDTGKIITQRRQTVGMSLAEYVRWVMTVHAHGFDHVDSLQRGRLEVVARIGEEKGYGDGNRTIR